MKHIFYFTWILFLLYELLWIANAREKIETTKKATKWIKDHKSDLPKSLSDWDSDAKSTLYQVLFIVIPVYVLKFIGLMSFNWVLFAAWIAFSFLFMMPLSKLFKDTKLYLPLHAFATIVNILVIIFAILNSYHLKIKLAELIF